MSVVQTNCDFSVNVVDMSVALVSTQYEVARPPPLFVNVVDKTWASVALWTGQLES